MGVFVHFALCVWVCFHISILGGLAVLGPVHQKEAGFCSSSHHWQISRQKLRPGSGCLTVSVSMDGPTRVLKIVDKCHRVCFLFIGYVCIAICISFSISLQVVF